MKALPRLLGLLLLLGVSAIAQNETSTAPTAELFGGYSFVHSSLPGQGLNANGGSVSFAINPERWLGFVADFGGYHGSVAGFGVTDLTYLFGPRFSYRSKSPVTPFAHVLFGGIHQGVSGFSASQNGFAMAIGGGFDLKVDSHWAWRMVQAEYLYSNLPNQQNNARISTGVVYRWD